MSAAVSSAAVSLPTVPADARARYERDGFLCPVDVFTPAEAAALRAEFDALEAQVGREASQVGLNGRHMDLPFVWRMVSDARVLAWIEALIGPNIVLLSSQFFCKYPAGEVGAYVAWHQDVTYWGLEPLEAHSAWIAIDDADDGNGCMQAIAGTHREGIAPHVTSSVPGNLLSIEQEIPDEYVDRSRVTSLAMKAGQMSLHHGKLFHASPPNRSQRRRCGLAVRYVPPHVRQVAANSRGKSYHMLRLRGGDPQGLHGDTPLPFPLG